MSEQNHNTAVTMLTPVLDGEQVALELGEPEWLAESRATGMTRVQGTAVEGGERTTMPLYAVDAEHALEYLERWNRCREAGLPVLPDAMLATDDTLYLPSPETETAKLYGPDTWLDMKAHCRLPEPETDAAFVRFVESDEALANLGEQLQELAARATRHGLSIPFFPIELLVNADGTTRPVLRHLYGTTAHYPQSAHDQEILRLMNETSASRLPGVLIQIYEELTSRAQAEAEGRLPVSPILLEELPGGQIATDYSAEGENPAAARNGKLRFTGALTLPDGARTFVPDGEVITLPDDVKTFMNAWPKYSSVFEDQVPQLVFRGKNGEVIVPTAKQEGDELYGSELLYTLNWRDLRHLPSAEADKQFLALLQPESFPQIRAEIERLGNLATENRLRLPYNPFQLLVHPDGSWKIVMEDLRGADAIPSNAGLNRLAEFPGINENASQSFLNSLAEIYDRLAPQQRGGRFRTTSRALLGLLRR